VPHRQRFENATDDELVEALLGSRAARCLAAEPLHRLLDYRPAQLAELGVRGRTSMRLLAAAEVARRHQPSVEARHPITAPRHALAHLRSLRALPNEVLSALLVDVRMCLIDIVKIAEGATARVAVSPKEVFAAALTRGAAALVLAHNHPSGNPEPSHEDVEFTRTMRDAGELLDVQVLDHLVVARRGYVSLREAGLI
jgi:DNA repair protein RadC